MNADKNKWLWHCINCKRLPECGAEKALLLWRDNQCIHWEGFHDDNT